MGNIQSHKELHVWQDAMDGAMEIFAITKAFPPEEKYSLVDQIRRSSRSVAANLAEAWRKRRYEAAFKSKLNDAEAEASGDADMVGSSASVFVHRQTNCG